MAAVAAQPIICLFADLQILPRVQLLLQTFHSFNLLYNSYGTINVSNTLQLYRGSQLSWHCPALSACLPDPAQQIVSESWPRIWFYLVNLAVMVLYFPASTGWCDNNKPSRTQPQQLCSILNRRMAWGGLVWQEGAAFPGGGGGTSSVDVNKWFQPASPGPLMAAHTSRLAPLRQPGESRRPGGPE